MCVCMSHLSRPQLPIPKGIATARSTVSTGKKRIGTEQNERWKVDRRGNEMGYDAKLVLILSAMCNRKTLSMLMLSND